MRGETLPRRPSGYTTGLQTAGLTDGLGLWVCLHTRMRVHTPLQMHQPHRCPRRGFYQGGPGRHWPAGFGVSLDSLDELPRREGTVTHFHKGDVKLVLKKRRNCT